MTQPLMPKATAVWLIENTALSFQQIAEFCGLHMLEIQSIADDEVAVGMVGFDPIANGQLTQEEIARCSADSEAKLEMAKPSFVIPEFKNKGPRYTPVARRQDRPDAISWMLRNYPELSDGQISRLVGTTKPTINAVRERTHWNISNIKPHDPVSLGLCNREDLAEAIEKARRAAERAEQRAEKEKARQKQEKAAAETVTAKTAAAETVAAETAAAETVAAETAAAETGAAEATAAETPPETAAPTAAFGSGFGAIPPAEPAAAEPAAPEAPSAPEATPREPAPTEDTPDEPAGVPPTE